jgi:quercetin dioxygenase-like cupin family protein
MTSFDRPLAGDTMVFDLAGETRTARSARVDGDSRRTARTLLKDGPLRMTLIVLDAGAEMAEHAAAGPITVQPIEGTIRFRAGADDEHVLRPGQVLSARAGVRHSVSSDDGAAFLLTVVIPERAT